MTKSKSIRSIYKEARGLGMPPARVTNTNLESFQKFVATETARRAHVQRTSKTDLYKIARGLGYEYAISHTNMVGLRKSINETHTRSLETQKLNQNKKRRNNERRPGGRGKLKNIRRQC